MAITQVGIVYNSSTKEVLRIVVPDNDAQLDAVTWTGAGESFYKMSKATYDLQTTLTALRATLTPILSLL